MAMCLNSQECSWLYKLNTRLKHSPDGVFLAKYFREATLWHQNACRQSLQMLSCCDWKCIFWYLQEGYFGSHYPLEKVFVNQEGCNYETLSPEARTMRLLQAELINQILEYPFVGKVYSAIEKCLTDDDGPFWQVPEEYTALYQTLLCRILEWQLVWRSVFWGCQELILKPSQDPLQMTIFVFNPRVRPSLLYPTGSIDPSRQIQW